MTKPEDTRTPPAHDYITLSDFLKWKGAADTGGHAKVLIQSGQVKVNGEVDTRRARKLRVGDRVQVDGAPEMTVDSLER